MTDMAWINGALTAARQVSLFPRIRAAYAARMGDQLAGVGLGIKAAGKANKRLTVASAALTSPVTIQEVHDRLSSQATRLRFSSAEYQAYMGAPITSFVVRGKSDDEPVLY